MIYMFDLDQTLVELFGVKPLPGSADFLRGLRADSSVYVLTNQAGVMWRIYTGNVRYPLTLQVAERYDRIVSEIPELSKARWFTSVYDDRLESLLPRGMFSLAARSLSIECRKRGLRARSSGRPDWRKPRPGMIRAALLDAGVPISRRTGRCQEGAATFVGDSETDFFAADHLGVKFVSAWEFFGRQGGRTDGVFSPDDPRPLGVDFLPGRGR